MYLTDLTTIENIKAKYKYHIIYIIIRVYLDRHFIFQNLKLIVSAYIFEHHAT